MPDVSKNNLQRKELSDISLDIETDDEAVNDAKFKQVLKMKIMYS